MIKCKEINEKIKFLTDIIKILNPLKDLNTVYLISSNTPKV